MKNLYDFEIEAIFLKKVLIILINSSRGSRAYVSLCTHGDQRETIALSSFLLPLGL